MRALSTFSKVYLSRDARDFRKGIDGLVAIVEGEMRLDPAQSYIFGFTNRRRDKVKLLYWDKTGYAIWFKRLEAHKFHWPKKNEADVVALSPQKLEWLLGGLDISRMRPHEELSYAANF